MHRPLKDQLRWWHSGAGAVVNDGGQQSFVQDDSTPVAVVKLDLVG